MKATLEFNLPESNYEFHHALHGTKYHLALTEIRNIVRSYNKYDVDVKTTMANISEVLAALPPDDDL